jgi:hypothetical protein
VARTQYWYLEDVKTLVRDGTTTTDTIFPVGLLGPGGTMSTFIHNVLSTYLAAGARPARWGIRWLAGP